MFRRNSMSHLPALAPFGAFALIAACSLSKPSTENARSTKSADTTSLAGVFPINTPVSIHVETVAGDKCLDVVSGLFASGTQVQVYACLAGNRNQQWIYDGTHLLAFGGAVQQDPVTGQSTQMCLDITGGGSSQTSLQTWACNGAAQQTWTYDGQTMEFIGWDGATQQNDLCIDDPFDNGDTTHVWAYWCNGGTPQQWAGYAFAMNADDPSAVNVPAPAGGALGVAQWLLKSGQDGSVYVAALDGNGNPVHTLQIQPSSSDTGLTVTQTFDGSRVLAMNDSVFTAATINQADVDLATALGNDIGAAGVAQDSPCWRLAAYVGGLAALGVALDEGTVVLVAAGGFEEIGEVLGKPIGNALHHVFEKVTGVKEGFDGTYQACLAQHGLCVPSGGACETGSASIGPVAPCCQSGGAYTCVPGLNTIGGDLGSCQPGGGSGSSSGGSGSGSSSGGCVPDDDCTNKCGEYVDNCGNTYTCAGAGCCSLCGSQCFGPYSCGDDGVCHCQSSCGDNPPDCYSDADCLDACGDQNLGLPGQCNGCVCICP